MRSKQYFVTRAGTYYLAKMDEEEGDYVCTMLELNKNRALICSSREEMEKYLQLYIADCIAAGGDTNRYEYVIVEEDVVVI